MSSKLTKSICLLAGLVLLMTPASRAANQVEVGVIPAHDTLWVGVESQFSIFMENDVVIKGLSLGFIISSPNGATWQWDSHPEGYGDSSYITIVPGSHADIIWDMIFAVIEFNVDGLTPDSILLGGALMMTEVPPGSLEHCFSLHFTPDEIGLDDMRTICIDSAWMPPSGSFVFVDNFGDNYTPIFGGPYCFPVKKCSADLDGDGICDFADNCPAVDNPGQEDSDGDKIGDACDVCLDQYDPGQDDSDGDDAGDLCDNCPDDYNADQADSDADGTGDICDNCLDTENPDQADGDGDTVGDLCDNCPDMANSDQADLDGDDIGNACDNCPTIPNFSQEDSNGNGIGDACEGIGPYQCGDTNTDGWVNVGDVLYLINFIFRDGPRPCEPEK